MVAVRAGILILLALEVPAPLKFSRVLATPCLRLPIPAELAAHCPVVHLGIEVLKLFIRRPSPLYRL